MTRKTLRWAIFVALLLVVIGIAVTNSISNARFTARLSAADPTSLAEFARRPDAYNLFISLDVPARLRIIGLLGKWRSPAAPKTIIMLARDPEIEVRAALVEALAQQIGDGTNLAEVGGTTDPAQRSTLIEALVLAGEPGLRQARSLFENQAARPNAAAALIRFGTPSTDYLIQALGSDDMGITMDAVETLSRIGDVPIGGDTRSLLWSLYQRAPDVQQKDRLLPILAQFAVEEAAPIFGETLADEAAPPKLRASAARGLSRLGLTEILAPYKDDPDPDVRSAAGG